MTTIAFDMAAMCIRSASSTPRGIDRVDMGYVTRIFSDPETTNVGLLPTPSHMGVLHGSEAREFALMVERHWREAKKPGDDSRSAWLRRRIAGDKAPMPARRLGDRGRSRNLLHFAKLLIHARRAPLRAAAAAIPQGAVYVNTGQILLGAGWFFDWLDQRPDVKPVFMMHDLIPVFYPEYCGRNESSHHVRAVRTVARRAIGMIATSHASADEIRDALKRHGRGEMPIHVVPLPVGDTFLADRASRPMPSERPFFVMVGTVDQRKNHLLLLHVWREIARSPLEPRPKLVIVGGRGKRSAGIVEFLQRSPDLAEHVIEVNGLSTPAMRELMRDARALLMPSFTEGYGLPIVEALAVGTPVIASDIPAHREVGGKFAFYLHPLDGRGWLNEITRRTAETLETVEERRAALKEYRPQTWDTYFDQVLPFLDSL